MTMKRKKLHGRVAKVIKSAYPNQPETAQIEITEAEDLYREVRIANEVSDENGEKAVLKPGAAVDVIVEADSNATVKKLLKFRRNGDQSQVRKTRSRRSLPTARPNHEKLRYRCGLVEERPSPRLPLHLAHQSQQILLRVAKENHPQIVVGHFRDQMRFVFETYLSSSHARISPVNIGHRKIKDGTGMVELRLLWPRQHQAHSAAIDERQARRRFEQ
jgi:hypothetical protein